jgi:hypothetical protein
MFLDNDSWPGTHEQRDFVIKALNTPDFAILEGPPGSGKTTTISEIIYQILMGSTGHRPRILLCASTHVAVDNVIQKLNEKFKDSEGGLLEAGIVPLRIGKDDEKIDDTVQRYRIDRRKKEYRALVENEEWFKNSSKEELENYIDEMVINCSNLVCGTTFGILQYPRFRKSRGLYTAPEFDYLIIDEASKTTFQEFLVPAIYAKKWILVGDVMQLSPFTDTLHIRVNLDRLLNQNREKAHIAFLKLIHERTKPGRDYRTGRALIPPRFIYVDSDEVIKELGKLIISKLVNVDEKGYHRYLKKFRFTIINNEVKSSRHMEEIGVILLREKDIEENVCALYDQDIILVPRSVYDRWRDTLPATHILVYPGENALNLHDFRHLDWTVWARGHGRMYTFDRGSLEEEGLDRIKAKFNDALCSSWADQLSWRMKRVFELQMSKKRESEKSSYNRAFSGMMTLLPDYSDDAETRRILRFVNKLRSIAFPSILTSLQAGFRKDKNLPHEDLSILSQGLPPEVKEERYTKLLHQYRMHSQIARIPRDLFYDGKALQQGIDDNERSWNNPLLERYPERVVWVDCQGKMTKNTNDAEARLMLRELSTFRENLRKSGKYIKDDGTPWEVLLLSFYKPQRKYIAELIKKTYPENDNTHRYTRFLLNADSQGKHKIQVYAYTVDNVQGKEDDIVFLSMVRREGNSIGFLDSPNRLNVAITRARYQLVIFGDKRFYERQNDYSHELSYLARGVNMFNPEPTITNAQAKIKVGVKG